MHQQLHDHLQEKMEDGRTRLETQFHDAGLNFTHEIKGGFTWPIQKEIDIDHNLGQILRPWEEVPEEYKLPRRCWHRYRPAYIVQDNGVSRVVRQRNSGVS